MVLLSFNFGKGLISQLTVIHALLNNITDFESAYFLRATLMPYLLHFAVNFCTCLHRRFHTQTIYAGGVSLMLFHSSQEPGSLRGRTRHLQTSKSRLF